MGGDRARRASGGTGRETPWCPAPTTPRPAVRETQRAGALSPPPRRLSVSGGRTCSHVCRGDGRHAFHPEDPAVDRHDLGARPTHVKEPPYKITTRICSAPRFARVRERFEHRAGKITVPRWRHQPTGLAGDDHVGETTDSSGDCRHPGGK